VRQLAALAALACLAAGCAASPPWEAPEERVDGRPLAEAPYPRSGDLSWRPIALVQSEDDVRFEFTLMNGTSRHFQSVMLRIVLRGPGSAIASVRYPTGAISPRSSRRVAALLASPGFEVERAELELIFAFE
jgi:hypothetical protein